MSEEIGQQLRSAREARSLTLEQVAHSTRMRLYYLNALEAGDFAALPSQAQARGFLRTYARFLGLNPESLLDELDRKSSPEAAPLEADGKAPGQGSPDGGKPGPQLSEGGGSEAGQAQHIFEDLGQRLHRQRELLGLSLEDVERHTHLRTHYLSALESGDLNGLPSPVQGRGMLKNYANFLGLDPEPLLLRFAEGLQARLALKQVTRSSQVSTDIAPKSARGPSTLRRVLSGDLLVGGIVVIFLAAFVTWSAIRVFALRSKEPVLSTAPSVAEVLLYTPPATITASPPPSTQPVAAPAVTADQPVEGTPGETQAANGTQVATLPGGKSGSVQVYLTVRQRAWMRVTVDGKVEFDGRVIPGSGYQFAGENQVEILTGNGAALQIFFNQQDLGPMGQFGQVVQRVFSPDGVQTPTPTITPTSSPTPRPSPTSGVTETATLKPFITATP